MTEHKPISTVEALRALVKIDNEETRKFFAQFIAERSGKRPAPGENTGLPCRYCDEKLPSIDIERDGDSDRVRVCVSMLAEQSDLKGLIKILREYAR